MYVVWPSSVCHLTRLVMLASCLATTSILQLTSISMNDRILWTCVLSAFSSTVDLLQRKYGLCEDTIEWMTCELYISFVESHKVRFKEGECLIKKMDLSQCWMAALQGYCRIEQHFNRNQAISKFFQAVMLFWRLLGTWTHAVRGYCWAFFNAWFITFYCRVFLSVRCCKGA